jgi:hypothetical protein
MVSPCVTRYCFPPVLMIAYTALSLPRPSPGETLEIITGYKRISTEDADGETDGDGHGDGDGNGEWDGNRGRTSAPNDGQEGKQRAPHSLRREAAWGVVRRT